ncbi:MAG TPA: sugar ABC transporter ATP-binding protein [Clostridiales bacterium]|nr:sugar ABC transporter ATP-binding protein [Clostridiales bacterium]
MAEEILRIENLSKSFGPTLANKNINLSLKRGSVHGLAGENGSGKSTLASIVCGIQKKDSGKIYKDGEEYSPANPIEAGNRHVSMVVQELGIVGNLSPVVNIFLGRTEQFKKNGILDFNKMEKAAREQLDKWELGELALDGMTETLSIGQRKILELIRALSIDPDLLILDEISQALSQDKREILYKFIKHFTGEGKTILMITHDLEEMLEICDTISVLRDGEIVATKACADFTLEELKHKMIGREIAGDYYRNDQEEQYGEEVILEVEKLGVPGQLEDVSFQLHKGEVLGVCGLSDAGIHTLGAALFGLLEHRTGKVCMKATGKLLNRPKDVIKAGGAYLSKDRDADGLMLDASIGDNIIVPNVGDMTGKFGFLSPGKVKKLAQETSEAYAIKSTGIDHIVKRLSGGNKQKVNLSRWLIKDLKFIILDCPTRGVDIGVKAYIYEVLRKAKKAGLGIILISDELSEAMGMSDRILVMRDHKKAGILSRTTDFTEDKIIEVML